MLKKKKKYIVAVVGATGAVGNEMIKTLEQREFPVEQLRLFASERSEGKALHFGDKEVIVEALNESSFKGIDIALFSAGAERSRIWAPVAAKSGCVVVDNSSQWRMDPKIPLVVPEVNPGDLKWHKGIIANPNCSTIQMVLVLKPIHDAAKIRRVVVTTFQAVSGTGQRRSMSCYSRRPACLPSERYNAMCIRIRLRLMFFPILILSLKTAIQKKR